MTLVLQYIGSHVLGEEDSGRHWNPVDHFGMHCGQSCGCCRAANPEDWGSGCDCCVDLWFARLTSKHMNGAIKDYDGRHDDKLRRHSSCAMPPQVYLDPCAVATRARVLITDDTFVLLVQERRHAWNLPGGGLEEEDRRLQSRPALQNCAHREVWEETGLALQHLEWMGCVEGQAVYVARFQYLSWSMIVTAFRHRRQTNEIRRVWWGSLEAALGEPGVDSRTTIAMAMLRSQSD